ncbi:MAG: hypothetical protein Ta2G_06070 [Termitinemataceae bacterium]|nr:MAG: hypothetical protein Ta2G_06070 [Termitinemataceae bacterium]
MFKEKKAGKFFACLFVLFCSIFGFSCGIETYVYLDPVTDIVREDTSRARINTPRPQSGNSSYSVTIDFPNYTYPNIKVTGTSTPGTSIFDDYVIYYKIYKSNSSAVSIPTETERIAVNTTLNTEYKNIDPYTDIESTSTSSPDSIFTSKHFFTLRADASGNLLRTNPNGAFTLKPDAYFISSDDLKKEPPTSVMNYDVAETTPASAEKVSTYVAMYIMETQFNSQSLTPIYSKPAFINIFKLPDPFTIIPVESITILDGSTEVSNITLTSSTPKQLTVKVLPDNASNKTVAWSIISSTPVIPDTVVVTVDSTGLITPSANGTAIINAESGDGSKSATCTITVSGL